MRADLKQHKQVFRDLLDVVGKLQDKCAEGESFFDFKPFNIDFKPRLLRTKNNIYILDEDYDTLIRLFLESINITLSVGEFFQKKVKIKGKSYVDLCNLKDEHAMLNDMGAEEEISLQSININIKDANYLDKKPFLNANEKKEEWNVKMIDSIINNIFKRENTSTTIESTRSRRKKNKGCDLSSRPFICQYKNCSSAFKRFEHLKRHYRIHTGERPFKCKYPGCFKKFARSDNLSQHLKIHNTGQNNYSNDTMPYYDDKY